MSTGLRRAASALALLAVSGLFVSASEQARWNIVPPAPSLPAHALAGQVDRGDASIWYASYGEADKPAVLLIHGGAGSSDHWGHLVRDLLVDHRVIVFDCRGQGRSSSTRAEYSYSQMADDAVDVLNRLGVRQASVVGWSDGANIGFYLARNYAERITKLIALGGNATPSGYQPNANPATLTAYIAMTNREYQTLSPHPKRRGELMKALRLMWKSQPTLSASDLSAIRTRTFVLHAEYDEIIREAHAREMARLLPNAEFVLLPTVSHFALFQDPRGLTAAVRKALKAE